jgi:hypothetical protein
MPFYEGLFLFGGGECGLPGPTGLAPQAGRSRPAGAARSQLRLRRCLSRPGFSSSTALGG